MREGFVRAVLACDLLFMLAIADLAAQTPPTVERCTQGFAHAGSGCDTCQPAGELPPGSFFVLECQLTRAPACGGDCGFRFTLSWGGPVIGQVDPAHTGLTIGPLPTVWATAGAQFLTASITEECTQSQAEICVKAQLCYEAGQPFHMSHVVICKKAICGPCPKPVWE